MMVVRTGAAGGSSASICLDSPEPERVKRALTAGETVRVQLDGAVDEVRMRDGHADVEMTIHDVAVRPEGRKTISRLIAAKQKDAVH